MLHRHEFDRQALVDAVVPALVAAMILVGELVHGGSSARPAPVALGLAAATVLWARRRAPASTLAASGVLVAVLLHVDRSAGTVAVVAPAVALYSFALRRGHRARLLAGAAAVAAVLSADLLHSGRPGILPTLGHMLLVAIPILAAETIRTHRAYLSLLTERLKLAEQAREQEAERRAEQERMRIARELHDVVAHTLTEINVQAAAAAERLAPGGARAALERIEDASQGAIGELRAILGVLRDSDHAAAPRVPAPGIENLSELIDRARDAGLDAQLQIAGEQPARLSDTASLAAYRIVQESLTNARRHAPGAPVRVKLRFDPVAASLEIESAASAESNGNPDAAGVGIVGMRERATALGGRLDAGPTANGFLVQAQLPYQPSG
jgi:signal transduction histidine kinase